MAQFYCLRGYKNIMTNLKKDFAKIVKRRITIIAFFIMLSILLLTFIILFINKNSNEQYVLINVYGNQRMITQKISKDANQKYEIIKHLQSNHIKVSEGDLENEINQINDSLINSKTEFQTALLSLHSKKITKNNKTINLKRSIYNMNDIISSIDSIWSDFSSAVDIIINSKEIDIDSNDAIIFININEKRLLNYSDEITKGLIINQKRYLNLIVSLAIFIFIILLILLYTSIVQLYKYIVIPLNELYMGLDNFRLIKDNKIKIYNKKEIRPIIDGINTNLTKLNKLFELIENINKDVSFDGILKYIYSSFSEFIPYHHIGVALLKNDKETLEASYGISDPSINDLPNKLMGIKANLNKTSLESVIVNGKPRIINDLESYINNKDTPYNKILIESNIKSSISLPLKVNDNPVGVIFFSSLNKNAYNLEHVKFLETISYSIALSLTKNIFIDELLISSLLALTKMTESRDEETGDHLERMKSYSVKISEFLFKEKLYEDEMNLSFIREIEKFSPMHDIGKVGIRDSILLKPDKLTKDEFEEMKNHAIYGAEVLRTAEKNIIKQSKSMFQMGVEIAEGHHERWDGTGYPYNKKGYNIPLSARIVSVADVFDALTSKRPYKKAFSFDESFELLVEGRGSHFDPNIIDLLIKNKNEFHNLYLTFSDQIQL